MGTEPDLGQSEDPRELVRGDVEAVRATVGHLTDLAEGFRATATGLRAIDVGAWTGSAADAFRARFTDAPAQWSCAAEAFGSAAQAWERFGSAMAAAQDSAGSAVARFRAGAAAADRAHAAYAAEVDRYLDGVAAGQSAGPGPVLDDAGAVEMEAARRMLADARALRDSTAADAARKIAEAAARSPDPLTGWDRRLAEAADWVGANGIELAHVAEGVGEGVEGLARLVRTLNPADPYNLNHPGRFVENGSAALSGAVDTLAHPLRVVTDLVGTGWGSDPARAFGHLVPVVMGAASAGARSVLGAAEAETARSALGAADAGASRSLWADPRPTARPFTPRAEPGSPPRPTGTQPGRADSGRATDPGRPTAADSGRATAADSGRATAADSGRATAARPDSATVEGAATGGATGDARADQATSDAPTSRPTKDAGSHPVPDARPDRAGMAEADRAAAERFDRLGRDLRSRIDRLAPKDIAPPATSARPTTPKTVPAPVVPGRNAIARALDPPRPRGRGPDAHHDPERARRSRLTRGDKDFSSPLNRHGARKSHLDARGDLVPANPEGTTSVVEHVVGRRSPVKGDSPYSSFTSPGARAEVQFGGYTIEVDVVRLQADIEAGLVPGVEIIPPHRVQAAIQADADRIAGRPVDLYIRKGHAASAARSYGLGAKATAALRQRIVDMANAQRHHEWMIRGVVPGRYVVGPHSEGRHG